MVDIIKHIEKALHRGKSLKVIAEELNISITRVSVLRAKHLPNIKIKKKCKGCGKILILVTNQIKFCSVECRYWYHRHRQRQPLQTGICVTCKKVYTRSINGGGNQKYCDARCRPEYKYTDGEFRYPCLNCKKDFTTDNKARLYCSVECGKAKRARRPIRNCKYCDKEFQPSDGRQKHCQIMCRIRYANYRKTNK